MPNLSHSSQIHYNLAMLASSTLDGLISKDPEMHNGRPTISGTGNTIRAIAIMYKQGLTPEEITVELPLSLAQVYAALTYYHLNTDEIEADIRRDFAQLHAAFLGDGRSHAGIIVPDQLEIGVVIRRLLKLLDARSAEQMQDWLEFLGSWR